MKLPPSASVATPLDGDRLHAPAAVRNAGALTDLLMCVAPRTGRALELASGTGQHIVAFATALPDLAWQPSEIDPLRRASIDAHAAAGPRTAIAPAIDLDACSPGWHRMHGGNDLIVLSNLTHLIPAFAVDVLLDEAAQALAPGGVLVLYGPFTRAGRLTSEGDIRFDAELRAADPAIGYKDDLDILRRLGDAGLGVSVTEMPANNLAFVARKSRP